MKEAADAELAEHYDLIDRHLADREWLVGDKRSVAGFFLFMLVRLGQFLEPQAWERLELSGVQKMIDEQGLELPEFACTTEAFAWRIFHAVNRGSVEARPSRDLRGRPKSFSPSLES